jgi:exosortase
VANSPQPTLATPECSTARPSTGPTVRWPGRPHWSTFAAFIAFIALWADLIRQLSYTWSTNEQYAYGWFVPILALGLLARKWPTRPSPLVPRSLGPLVLVTAVIITAILLLPVRVVHEINQDWPLFSWTLTLGIVGISLYGVYLVGGLRWITYFAFPICFILVAVKWPYRIEHALTQNLMRVVASISVELLGWLDIPAVQRGNLIELSTGVVGVDEACSGIRSLQSTVMAALFIGELYLFRWPLRLLLVLTGTVLAFSLNVARALFLAWQAASDGSGAIEKWHDSAGITIVLICFACLWLVAAVLNAKGKAHRATTEADREARPRTSDQHSPTPSLCLLSHGPGALPLGFAYALAAWVALLLLGNELWYRAHEMSPHESVRWWVAFPTNSPSFREVPISEFARKLLKYDQGATGSWTEADGTQWSAYCFRWRAGDPTARMSALGHRPEYCLTGSGHELKANLGIKFVPVSGLELPFRTYLFESAERPLQVFFCLWQDGAEKQAGFSPSKYADRLRATLEGRRGLGQQTLEIICSGYTGIADADQAVRERLPQLLRIDHQGTGGIARVITP